MGSLKLMEVQLSERKHGVELTREAQLDARERLLKELANNATSMQVRPFSPYLLATRPLCAFRTLQPFSN